MDPLELHEKRLDGHEARIRFLERLAAMAGGAVALASAFHTLTMLLKGLILK